MLNALNQLNIISLQGELQMADINSVRIQIIESAKELYKDNLYKILLYGSYARGDHNEESDVDIMILLNCNENELKQYRKSTSKMASRIGLDNDVEVSLVIRDKTSFEARQRIIPFYSNVSREGVLLYG